MPATSKAQFRFLQAVAHGGIKKAGLSKDKAKEMVGKNLGANAYKKLREQSKKDK